MSTDIKGPFAVLKLPRQNLALLLYGKKVLVAMTSNPHFPAPSPPLAVLEAAVAALDASETATGGGKASTAQRNIDRRALTLCLEHERHHVQSVAEQEFQFADFVSTIDCAAQIVPFDVGFLGADSVPELLQLFNRRRQTGQRNARQPLFQMRVASKQGKGVGVAQAHGE